MNHENKSEISVQVPEKEVIKLMLIALVSFEVFLVLIDAFVNYGRLTDIGAIRRLSNIAREDGLGTWFASTQTLFAGLTAMLIYMLSKQLGKASSQTTGWLVIACFFMFMAVDDASQIHERVGTAFKTIAGREGNDMLGAILHISPSYPWQLIFLPIFGSIGLYMTYFLWKELKDKASRKLVLLALVFMGIAIILDFFEGLEKSHDWNIYTYIRDYYEVRSYTVWHFAKVAEEFLEMLSITTFWIVFMKQLFRVVKPNGVKIEVSS